ncbi:DUF58 domain-containing protein [Halothiobacillus sp.]|uniref:DUF58 domain-containing protein n=1 Tax=Halothiobacillus sp. TaxID=1891311 RepID=UPI002AD41076|nr:DUF58 domain-containing protein [Halothiobacillus sp.]
MAVAVQQCSLKPNRIGLSFIFLVIAMLLAAINYGNNLVFFISFLLISLIGNSAWQTRRQLKSCQILTGDIPARHAGEPGIWPVVLESSLNNPAIAIRIEGNGAAPSIIKSVLIGVQVSISLPLPPTTRGLHTAPDIVFGTNYPIGLWTAQCRIVTTQTRQWVYPRPRGNQPLPRAPQTEISPQSAAVTTAQDDTHFDHLRPYVPGDPLSRLAFKQWAKTGQLVTQHWIGTQGSAHETNLDYSNMGGDHEVRLEQLAQWIEWLSQAQDYYVLRLPGQMERRGRGPRHRQDCLEAITVFQTPHAHVAGIRPS